MERRRLAVLCSHLRQIDLDRPISPQRLRSNVVSHAPTSSCSNSAEESEKGSEEKDCIFCMIIRGESPAFKLYEDDLWVCILDSNPLSHGHSLVIPKSHYSSLGVTPPSVVAAMFYKVPFLSKAIMKATHCDSFNLLVNNGAAAGQVIFHTHLHIIPRKACDQLWTHQSFRRKPLKPGQDTASLADCIREWLLLPVNSSESFQVVKRSIYWQTSHWINMYKLRNLGCAHFLLPNLREPEDPAGGPILHCCCSVPRKGEILLWIDSFFRCIFTRKQKCLEISQ